MLWYTVLLTQLGCKLLGVVAWSEAMYLRRVVRGERVYLDLVEGHRDPQSGKVRQRVLGHLGREEQVTPHLPALIQTFSPGQLNRYFGGLVTFLSARSRYLWTARVQVRVEPIELGSGEVPSRVHELHERVAIQMARPIPSVREYESKAVVTRSCSSPAQSFRHGRSGTGWWEGGDRGARTQAWRW